MVLTPAPQVLDVPLAIITVALAFALTLFATEVLKAPPPSQVDFIVPTLRMTHMSLV